MPKSKAFSHTKKLSRTRSMGASLSNDLGVNPVGSSSIGGLGAGPGMFPAAGNISKSKLFSQEFTPKKKRS